VTRIWNLVLKEFIQLRRDWLMTLFILTLPVLQLILMAQATGSRVSNRCVAVFDLDYSADSRRLIATLDNREELRVCRLPATLSETRRDLDQGDAIVAVVIPAGFAAAIADGTRTVHLQIIADASST
jgi:ABC-2 type transport system permease protein